MAENTNDDPQQQEQQQHLTISVPYFASSSSVETPNTARNGMMNRTRRVMSQNLRSLTRLDTAYSNNPYSNLTTIQRTDASRKSTRRRDVRDIFSVEDGVEAGVHSTISTPPADFSAVESPEATSQPILQQPQGHGHHGSGHLHPALALLLRSIAAVGVIYGDIGTSPLYTYTAIFEHQIEAGQIPSKNDILGAASNVVYTLIFIVCVKYCAFVLRADFNMEGGPFALYQRVMCAKDKMSRFRRMVLLGLTCAGASLLLGESSITPAISILSALEGIELVAPGFKSAVIYVGIAILILLFAFQYKGTEKVGVVFGPVMVLWFLSIGIIGIYNLATYDPSATALTAFSPVVLIRWWSTGYYAGYQGWKTMASVVLTVTGTEAMFADMGHFGRDPVYASWFCFVFPCLILQYMGQTAFLLHVVSNPSEDFDTTAKIFTTAFWSCVPQQPVVYYGMIAVATLATIVASQALITGAFTLMSQASALEILPKLNVVHTSVHQRGQVYIGTINFVLLILCCILVLTFQTSANLAAAYGCAVTSVFFITTNIICWFVAPYTWNFPWYICLLMYLFQGSIDGIFMTSNFLKVPDGGWFPLLLATIILSTMGIWKGGKVLSDKAYRLEKEEALSHSAIERKAGNLLTLDELKDPAIGKQLSRGSGIAIFLTPHENEMPIAMLKLMSRLGVLSRYVILLTITTSSEPFVFAEDKIRVSVVDGDLDIYSFVLTYGWAEPLSEMNIALFIRDAVTDVHEVEQLLPDEMAKLLKGLDLEKKGSTVVLRNSDKPVSLFVNSHITKAADGRNFIMRVVITAYTLLRRLFHSSPVEYFNLPANNTTEVGTVLFL